MHARRALAAWEAGFGKNHPNFADAHNNLAQLPQDTGAVKSSRAI